MGSKWQQAYPGQNDIFDIAHPVSLVDALLHVCIVDGHHLCTPACKSEPNTGKTCSGSLWVGLQQANSTAQDVPAGVLCQRHAWLQVSMQDWQDPFVDWPSLCNLMIATTGTWEPAHTHTLPAGMILSSN